MDSKMLLLILLLLTILSQPGMNVIFEWISGPYKPQMPVVDDAEATQLQSAPLLFIDILINPRDGNEKKVVKANPSKKKMKTRKGAPVRVSRRKKVKIALFFKFF